MNSSLMPLKKAEPKPPANQRSIQTPGAGTCPPLKKMSRISRRVIFTAIPLLSARIISTVESSPPRNIHGPFPAAFFFLSPAAPKRRQIHFKCAPALSFPLTVVLSYPLHTLSCRICKISPAASARSPAYNLSPRALFRPVR